MKLLSVNLGLPCDVEWQGKRVRTSIFKSPAPGHVRVATLNLEGDEQSDLSVHGGIHKAVYAYASEHYLGLLYRDGKGVAQDYGEALQWFQKAVDAGSASAMRHLGLLYYEGEGVARDYDKAYQWYEKAADAGDRYAMYNVGFLYANGNGVAQDYVKARARFQKAVAAGDPKGMTGLGWLSVFF
jgi:TPR repeat protein